MKHARLLRRILDTEVEPDGTIEGHLLVYEEVGEFVGVGLRVVFGREVTTLFAPFADASHDAADQLPDARLAFGRADVAAEIFRDDDVGRQLAPGLRDLDVLLFEDDFALLVADRRVA